jgi:hypothetical protein
LFAFFAAACGGGSAMAGTANGETSSSAASATAAPGTALQRIFKAISQVRANIGNTPTCFGYDSDNFAATCLSSAMRWRCLRFHLPAT